MKKILLFSTLLLLSIASKSQKFDWAFNIHGSYTDLAGDIAVDNNGYIYITGSFSGTADFDPDTGVFNLSTGVLGGIGNTYIAKYDSAKNLIWAKKFGSNIGTKGNNLSIDSNGDIIVSGIYVDTLDVDPSSGVFNIIGSGLQSVFIIKLDTNGNLVWGKSLNATNVVLDYSIATNQFNEIIISGYFRDTVDFDPGSGIVNLIGSPTGSGFVVMLDINGNYIFAYVFGANFTTSLTTINSIKFDPLNNIFLTGYFSNIVDFDPGAGVSSLNANNGSGFLLKLDNTGNFSWVRQLPGTPNDFAFDSVYNFILTGTFQNSWDFDPGPNVFNLTSSGYNDLFVLKIDSTGNFQSAFNFNSTATQSVYTLNIDQQENIYILGNFNGSMDFDPGIGIYSINIPAVGNGADFILKLNENGDFVWVNIITPIFIGNKKTFFIDTKNDLYIHGHFSNIVDFDPSQNLHYLDAGNFYDVYILKLRNDSCSNLTLVIDSVSDVTCTQNGFASAFALSGNSPYSYSWNTTPPTNDSILTANNSGIYTVTVTDNIGCTRTSSILINSPAFITQFDLNINLTAPILNPNFLSNIFLDGFNDGCLPQSGNLILILDSNVNYINASPPPDVIYGDSLLWFFSNLTYGAPFTPQIQITLDSTVNLGDILCFEAQILPVSGDADTSNNIKHYCFTVVNSYDPNDKQVYPVGDCNSGLITNDKKLTYTIRFQNTGNAEAFNIYVLDTLSNSLDINSVKIVGKSHEPMITEIINGNILKFRFDNIHLPDSTTNEPASHGYVIFEVDPHAGTGNGTIINNSAAIFFDFNEPIITNAVMNTFVNSIPTVNTQVAQINNTLVSAATGATYQWVDCNNNFNIIPGEINHSFTATNNGSYAVIVNQGGCIDTSLCFSFIVGIHENVSLNNLIVFPNPFREELNIILNDLNSPELTIKLLNVMGQVIYSSEKERLTDKTEFKISTVELESGIYFLDLKSEKESLTKKIIKIW